MHHFHHRSQITLLLKITRVDSNHVEKLFCIDQVEITSQCQIPCRNNIPFDKGMTEFDVIFSLCTIAKVTKQKLPHEIEVPFHHARMLSDIGLVFFELVDFLSHL